MCACRKTANTHVFHSFRKPMTCTHCKAHIYRYIYIYMWYLPPNHRPSFCIVNTVSNQLFRQVRIGCLSKTAKTKLTLQEKAPVNSFRFDVSTHSITTLYSSIQKPTARHLVQVRREHAGNGNTVLFQSETNFFLGKAKKAKNDIFWAPTENQLFPRKKFVFWPKTFFS